MGTWHPSMLVVLTRVRGNTVCPRCPLTPVQQHRRQMTACPRPPQTQAAVACWCSTCSKSCSATPCTLIRYLRFWPSNSAVDWLQSVHNLLTATCCVSIHSYQVTLRALQIFDYQVHPSQLKGAGRAKEGMVVQRSMPSACTQHALALQGSRLQCARLFTVCASGLHCDADWAPLPSQLDATPVAVTRRNLQAPSSHRSAAPA